MFTLERFTASVFSSALALRLIDCLAPIPMLSHSFVIGLLTEATNIIPQAASIPDEYKTIIAVLTHNKICEIMVADATVHSWSSTVSSSMISVPATFLCAVFGHTFMKECFKGYHARQNILEKGIKQTPHDLDLDTLDSITSSETLKRLRRTNRSVVEESATIH